MSTVRTRRVHRPISLLPTVCIIRHGANTVTTCPFLDTMDRRMRCLLTKEHVYLDDNKQYLRTNQCLNTISTVLIAIDVKELVPDVDVLTDKGES